ncbi:ribosome small subunit-dependent GTPase A [Tahibacter sp.]|uniref:ribosome small subunit-dependent GTPase A n=1 Tax=Tahibacter sp. TaxID=2056211 RepID=UPI0028C4F998|nr:ribosome small subunit-dependent GTPase A [Tahibacter sp.]
MTSHAASLADLGWSPFFSAQLDLAEYETCLPVRVLSVHRGRLLTAGAGFEQSVTPFAAVEGDEQTLATVGDWLLLDAASRRPLRLLRRSSLFRRRAAGSAVRLQLIAANVDTVFIVSSCNQDFNPARLERYLSLAREAAVTPVVVLTKADLCAETADYAAAAARLLPGLLVEVVDARSEQAAATLLPWCGRGSTVALLGSSGVGKSTLVNTLAAAGQATQGIREDDARGRHTTTARSLHRLVSGGWLVDTPGMRELQLAEVRSGLADVFADILMLQAGCRFGDCGHHGEPDCAVAEAIASGVLDPARLRRWRKLVAEEAHASETLRERRERERGFGRMARDAIAGKRARRDG